MTTLSPLDRTIKLAMSRYEVKKPEQVWAFLGRDRRDIRDAEQHGRRRGVPVA